uniref:Eukaryotic peptide chain release factor subunit 1 n=1 Tax=Cercocebus atys TaxID=9531 RepID=A0A2K5LC21_CERAT
LLADKFGIASNIELKLYNKVPSNGLVVYCGTTVTEEGKEKKVNIDFEPFKPINTSLYLCDNKFHTEALIALLSDYSKFGFIVIDGSGAVFVLHKFIVDLPKKHGKGGQSSLCFASLRMEKRYNYVWKVLFISGDKVNVTGLVLAGSANFKTELILKLVCISYGAIELSTEVLSNFDKISQDMGKYCFGIEDSLKALKMGAVEILIVFENLDNEICSSLTRHRRGENSLTPEQEKDTSHFIDKKTGWEHELIESIPLLEWFANNYKKCGAMLEIVTDKSQEMSQFVKGFGRSGGILWYQGIECQETMNFFTLVTSR